MRGDIRSELSFEIAQSGDRIEAEIGDLMKRSLVSMNEKRRKRYAEDPEYRKMIKERCRAYYHAHRQEIIESQRRRHQANRLAHRWGQLRRSYGISMQQYQELLARQGGVCGICRQVPAETFAVDHCHATGKVRGLLCRRCNTGLGSYRDDERLMMAAMAYLRKAALSGKPQRDDWHSPRHELITVSVLPADAIGALAGGLCLALDNAWRGGASAHNRKTQKRLEVNMSSDDAPPDGGNASKPMHEALSAALARETEGGDGQTAQTLHLVARTLVARALDGDISAIKEIFDRMDGRSAAAATVDDGPRKVTLEWKDSDAWSTSDPDINSSPPTASGSASPAS